MQHPSLHIALRVALVVIGLRLVLFFAEFDSDFAEPFYFFVNLGALPALAIYAVWPRGEAGGFLRDAKASLRVLGLYSLIMTAFFFVYYGYIDKEFFPSRHEQFIHGELSAAAEKGEDLDPEEARRKVESFFSLRNGTAVVLAVYMAFSLFYSIFFSAVKRAVPHLRKG